VSAATGKDDKDDYNSFSKMIPVPAFITKCGYGYGMAACPMLKVLVTASHNDLTVFALPDSLAVTPGVRSGLTRIRTIGGGGCAQFKFMDYAGVSGYMAFTGATAATRMLLVTDSGNHAVHVIDVVHGAHVGYLAAPGSICKPRCVAAWGLKVAVSAFFQGGVNSFVQLYEGTGATWTVGRMIRTGCPSAVRFANDGKELAVSVSLYRVHDGAFVRHLIVGLGDLPADVEECAEYGWVVLLWDGSHSIQFAGGAGGAGGTGDRVLLGGEFVYPSAMAFVPGLGLVVREFGNGGRVQLFATPDAVAMAAMSVMRTTWMTTVLRFAINNWKE
jgi:hypothetical protein